MKKEIVNIPVRALGSEIQTDKEYRCPVCRRLLMRGQVIRVETRCPKCKRIITIHK